jgi:pilus assembly protein FimV
LNAPTQPLEEQGLATLLSATQSDISEMRGMDMDSLETDTSYFSNTGLTDEKPSTPVQAPEPDPEMILGDSLNEADFNLDEISDDLAVPNTMPRPESVELSTELASIDFDFLDVPKSVAEPAADTAVSEPAFESVTDQQPAMEFTLDDVPAEAASPELASMDFEIPETSSAAPTGETSKLTADAAQTQPADEPMDFDLSGISLELDPDASAATPELLTDGLDAGSFSSSAEMATKLDLAIAYQEIGDKEGARELLDEVLKGGSPEQSEKAKNLLLELA